MPSSPQLAVDGELSGPATLMAVMIVLVLIIFFSFLMLVLKYYKLCPSNRIMVIYGKTARGQAAECISGGARFVVPLIQDYAWLSLEPIQIEIPLRGALSAEKIRVNVPSVFTVAIGTSPELMQNAAIRLLGLSFREIEKQASEIIFGQLREVLASMRIKEINENRDTFLTNILNSLEPELRKIGLLAINVHITDITDESGYIEAIGQKAAAEAINQARRDVARVQGVSAARFVADELKRGTLTKEYRQEIRRLLDAADEGKKPE